MEQKKQKDRKRGPARQRKGREDEKQKWCNLPPVLFITAAPPGTRPVGARVHGWSAASAVHSGIRSHSEKISARRLTRCRNVKKQS